jgi:hypothetical protein
MPTASVPGKFSTLEDTRTNRRAFQPAQWSVFDETRTARRAFQHEQWSVFEETRTARLAMDAGRFSARQVQQVKQIARWDEKIRIAASQPARFDCRGWHAASAAAGFAERAETAVATATAFGVRGETLARLATRSMVLVRKSTRVFARNRATGVVTCLGEIDSEATEQRLVDVALLPGTYDIWCERDSLLWHGARRGAVQTITIAAGQDPVAHNLPQAMNLAASIADGITTITWTAVPAEFDSGVLWGLWFGITSPVNIARTPDMTTTPWYGETVCHAARVQSSAETVAIAALGPDGTIGPSAELFLPWSDASPASPANQTARP